MALSNPNKETSDRDRLDEQKFRAMFENSAVPLFISTDERVLLANRALSDLSLIHICSGLAINALRTVRDCHRGVGNDSSGVVADCAADGA